MKWNSKTWMIAAVIAVFGLTAYEVGAKMMAATGYHILNKSDSVFTTTAPTGCPGITFPASIAANSVNPDQSNQIQFDTSKISSNTPCSTTYTSENGGVCVVGVTVNVNNATMVGVELTASGGICASPAGSPNVLIGASS